MVVSQQVADYYAVLQVHPDADFEVIEAAYRQLMKKYHPDLAGDDARRIAEHHRRATAINQAYTVLRDAEQRLEYDRTRLRVGTRPPPPASTPPPAPPRSSSPSEPGASTTWTPPTPPFDAAAIVEQPGERLSLPAPLSWLASAYYLLPGPYEWEPGAGKDLLITLLMPVIGTAAFALASGRLTPLIGTAPTSNLLAWAALIILCMPLVHSLPRVIMACGPAALLMSGTLNNFMVGTHVPMWAGWAIVCVLSTIFAARQFLFGVLPTLALCWLVAGTR